MMNSSLWETVYVDTDWSTVFHWKDAGVSDQQTEEKNVITALFDVIAASLGVRFNYKKAQHLYETGDLQLPKLLYDIFVGSSRQERYRR